MASSKQDEAICCMKEHRWNDAILILTIDIHNFPRDPWSPMYLGSCYYELRDYSRALEWFQLAERLAPSSSTPLGLQADALHCLGDTKAARALYLRALELDPEDELAIKNWKRFAEIERQ